MASRALFAFSVQTLQNSPWCLKNDLPPKRNILYSLSQRGSEHPTPILLQYYLASLRCSVQRTQIVTSSLLSAKKTSPFALFSLIVWCIWRAVVSVFVKMHSCIATRGKFFHTLVPLSTLGIKLYQCRIRGGNWKRCGPRCVTVRSLPAQDYEERRWTSIPELWENEADLGLTYLRYVMLCCRRVVMFMLAMSSWWAIS